MGGILLLLIVSVMGPLLFLLYSLRNGDWQGWMVALMVSGAVAAGFVQFLFGFLILIATRGDIVAALLPTIITGFVLLILRKGLWARLAAIALFITCFIHFLPAGTLPGKVSFTEMPIQRHETDSTLWESVLVKHHPKDSLALRDAMVGYFDDLMRGHEKSGDMSVWFYEYNSYTRVFIDNKQDPYDFARVYLDSDDRYTLGRVCIYVNDSTQVKTVFYRTARSGYYDPCLREEVIWERTKDWKWR